MERPTDEWFESEPRTREGMIAELQRIKIRAVARPLPIFLLALVITGALVYKITSKKPLVEAEVVLLLTDGSLARRDTPIPVEDLKDYVANVLMPDDKLLELIEKRDLYRLRKTQGNQFALDELREQVEVEVWKNSYVYYDPDIESAEHSARIGISVTDTDPDLAFDLARDLASIVVTTLDEHKRHAANELSTEVAAYRQGLQRELQAVQQQQAENLAAMQGAKAEIVPALKIVRQRLDTDEKRLQEQLLTAATSDDAIADRIAAAGLDTSIEVVEEQRPERPAHKSFVLFMIIAVVAVGSLFGAALVVGAFDSRVHDDEDVTRLGLPVIGHIPSFPGDHIGSLASRGIHRGRVSRYVIAGLPLLLVCGPIGIILLVLGYRESRRSIGTITGGGIAVAAIIAWCVLVVAALVVAGRG